MPPRSPLRVLPPLALAGVVAAVLAVVSSAGAPPASDVERAATTTTAAAAPSPRRSYRVRRGDDLSSVAVRFDVPLQQIVDLNPRVDPQSVSIGTVLRLRR